jgi:hypothetical protein
MKLSPTEIYNNRRVFFIGSTGFVGKVALSMLLARFPRRRACLYDGARAQPGRKRDALLE